MKTFGVSSEISSIINENLNGIKVGRIGVLETPIPSTVELAKYCYPEYDQIIKSVTKILNLKNNIKVKSVIILISRFKFYWSILI